MELDVRDWLIILGTLVAAGFILDAYRRVRAHQKEQLRVSAKARSEDDELNNPELPGGGARVAARQVAARKKAVPSYERDERLGADSDENDEPVPMLMDSVGEPGQPEPHDPPNDPIDDGNAYQDEAENLDDDGISPVRVKSEREADSAKTDSEKADTPKKEDAGRSTNLPEEIIVLHVVAPEDSPIRGPDLLQILLACDVRYGAMEIFHRHEQAGGEGPEQFSVANMVAPGTFDLDAMDDFTTPGVSFFMKLPGPKDAIRAFDAMVETAQCLIKNLGCELHDEARSVVTTQTLQHLRQRIRDFERRQLTLV